MFYKVSNNKIRFYKIEIDKKIYKLREELINKFGNKEHRNFVYNTVFNPLEKNSKVINFRYKRRMLFFYEYDYDIIYYPEIVILLDSLIKTKDYKNLKELNKYQAPLSIRKLDDSRYKNNLLRREYPYNSYIKELKSCFKSVLMEEITYTNEIDLLTKLIEHDVENKKQLQKVINIMQDKTNEYQDLIDELNYSEAI